MFFTQYSSSIFKIVRNGFTQHTLFALFIALVLMVLSPVKLMSAPGTGSTVLLPNFFNLKTSPPPIEPSATLRKEIYPKLKSRYFSPCFLVTIANVKISIPGFAGKDRGKYQFRFVVWDILNCVHQWFYFGPLPGTIRSLQE